MEDNQLYISKSIQKDLPAMVRNELAKLNAQKQEEFTEEFVRNKKSIGMAYLCTVLLGLHYGYLRKWGLQIVFWLTGGGLLIWWFIDLFRIPGLIKNYNKDKAMDIMRNLKAISA